MSWEARASPRRPRTASEARARGASRSASASRPAGVIQASTWRRSCRQRLRRTTLLASRRPRSRVTPGLFSIIRWPISRVGRPEEPAPRRIRSTLYCCRVIPRASTTPERTRLRRSVVRRRATTPSAALDANGRPCLISFWMALIAGQLTPQYMTSQVKRGEAPLVAGSGRFVVSLPGDGPGPSRGHVRPRPPPRDEELPEAAPRAGGGRARDRGQRGLRDRRAPPPRPAGRRALSDHP